MGTKTNFRVKVMKYAHQLATNTGKSWRFCMIKAWELYRLSKKMREGIVKFAYEKKDGGPYSLGTFCPVGACSFFLKAGGFSLARREDSPPRVIP